MTKYIVPLVTVIILLSCKNNKKSLAGDQHVETDEFYEAYEQLKLPFIVSDTSINKFTDTSTISYKIFTQFVPDSIFNTPFGKDRKLTIHPIGKIVDNQKEAYFATLVNSKSRTAVYLSVFDKNKFKVSMPLVVSNEDEDVTTASIDKKLTIVVNREWTIKNDSYYNRTIYAYNNVGIFTTVLTETNEESSAKTAFLNTLDTLPKKFKYSGDYKKGDKNFVVIRDGNTPNQYRFFVHFTNGKEDDPCEGELKGQFVMSSEKEGSYTGAGDPCILNFSFSGNQVKVKETGSCGNYRGIKCFFDDTYTKKRESRATSGKKK